MVAPETDAGARCITLGWGWRVAEVQRYERCGDVRDRDVCVRDEECLYMQEILGQGNRRGKIKCVR